MTFSFLSKCQLNFSFFSRSSVSVLYLLPCTLLTSNIRLFVPVRRWTFSAVIYFLRQLWKKTNNKQTDTFYSSTVWKVSHEGRHKLTVLPVPNNDGPPARPPNPRPPDIHCGRREPILSPSSGFSKSFSKPNSPAMRPCAAAPSSTAAPSPGGRKCHCILVWFICARCDKLLPAARLLILSATRNRTQHSVYPPCIHLGFFFFFLSSRCK